MRKLFLLPLAALLALSVPAYGSGGHGGGDKKSAEARKPPVHKITQSDSYLMIDPIYTSIMEGDQPLGLLMIGIGLDVPDSHLREEVTLRLPNLRDAYVRTLLNYSATAVRPWRQPNVVDIANRLQRVTDSVLKKKGTRILLAQVAMRLTR